MCAATGAGRARGTGHPRATRACVCGRALLEAPAVRQDACVLLLPRELSVRTWLVGLVRDGFVSPGLSQNVHFVTFLTFGPPMGDIFYPTMNKLENNIPERCTFAEFSF